jgi:hypothetical protein
MARSLTIKHEETATTSRLFTVFLLLSAGVLVATAFAGEDTTIDPGPSLSVGK